MKAWLNFYKEHSQAIFRLKVVVLIIANITFVYLITTEMRLPVRDFEIKGYWLEKVITTGLGVFGYTLGGLGVSLNSVKLLFLLSMFIVLNAVVLYHSTIMFAASILYMMKTCNKIYTNFLINKENLYILGLTFEHKLTEAEKKEILDAIFTSKIKVNDINDTNLYDGLYAMVMELNDKQAIQELVTKKIAMYTMEMEKRAESFRSLQVEKSYDYIQAGLDGIWSYMTPKNVIIGISIIGLGITMFWIYNGVIGSATKDLVKDISTETTTTSADVSEAIMQTLKEVELKNQEIIAQNLKILKQHSELTLQMDAINKQQDLNIVQIQKETLDIIKKNELRVATIVDYVNQKFAEYDDLNSSTISQLRTITSRMRLLRESIFELRGIRYPEE